MIKLTRSVVLLVLLCFLGVTKDTYYASAEDLPEGEYTLEEINAFLEEANQNKGDASDQGNTDEE